MIADQVRAAGQEALAPGRGTGPVPVGPKTVHVSRHGPPWIFPIDIKLSHPRRNRAEIKVWAEHPVEGSTITGKSYPGDRVSLILNSGPEGEA
jgi:hypothetical protein